MLKKTNRPENAKMQLALERRNEMLSILQKDERVLVSDLSKLYQVSEETIRRDLEKLEQMGMAKKTYGGAILNKGINTELPYRLRKKANVKEKKYIAEIIGNMIYDRDSIMLDASSTSLFIVKNIKHKKNITLITNSIEILFEVADKTDWKVLSTGGELKNGTLSLVGYSAIKMLESFYVDKSIISCKGVDIDQGVGDSDQMDAQIKNTMLKLAHQKILAVDHSKFDKKTFSKITTIDNIHTIVTDRSVGEKWQQFLDPLQVELIF